MNGAAQLPAVQSSKVPLVLAADENYAMPLATALRSLADANQIHWPLDVHILTDGFSESMKSKVVDSIPHGSANLRWAEIDFSNYDGLRLMRHVSRITFARLQIPELFDSSVVRVLYLDVDVLVLGDLDALWSANLQDAPLGAVFDSTLGGSTTVGRANLVVGVPHVKNYFNAGVLLMSLPACGRRHVFQTARDYLAAHPQTPYADQDALNVACDGVWCELPDKWNFQKHHITRVIRVPSTERPAIVHFVSNSKPWLPEQYQRQCVAL